MNNGHVNSSSSQLVKHSINNLIHGAHPAYRHFTALTKLRVGFDLPMFYIVSSSAFIDDYQLSSTFNTCFKYFEVVILTLR